MNVKELIKELEKVPADATVLISQDPEGNCFYKFFGVFKQDDWQNTFVIYPTYGKKPSEDDGRIIP